MRTKEEIQQIIYDWTKPLVQRIIGLEKQIRLRAYSEKRETVSGGGVSERDDSGEDRDAEHRDDPTASPDPEKGPDESPEAKTEGATVEWKLNRLLATVQERYRVERVLHTIYLPDEDYRELCGWEVNVTWSCSPWSAKVKINPFLTPGKVQLCFHETHKT